MQSHSGALSAERSERLGGRAAGGPLLPPGGGGRPGCQRRSEGLRNVGGRGPAPAPARLAGEGLLLPFDPGRATMVSRLR